MTNTTALKPIDPARVERAAKRYTAAYDAWMSSGLHSDDPEWGRLHKALQRALRTWEKAAGVC